MFGALYFQAWYFGGNITAASGPPVGYLRGVVSVCPYFGGSVDAASHFGGCVSARPYFGGEVAAN